MTGLSQQSDDDDQSTLWKKLQEYLKTEVNAVRSRLLNQYKNGNNKITIVLKRFIQLVQSIT